MGDGRIRAGDFLKTGILMGGVGWALAREAPGFFLGWAAGSAVYLLVVVLVALIDWDIRNRGRRPDGMPEPGPSELVAPTVTLLPSAGPMNFGAAGLPGPDDFGNPP